PYTTSMPFVLDASYAQLRDEARAVCDAVAPFAAEADALSTVHAGVFDALAGSHLWELVVPASHGGAPPRGGPPPSAGAAAGRVVAVGVGRGGLMGTSSHLDSLFALQGIGSYAITAGGSEAQKDRWLPPVLSGEALAALALTEPEAGSDLKGITTELTPDGDG